MRAICLVFVALIATSSLSQEFYFYKGTNAFGQKMYGLEDENGLEVTGLKWQTYYDYESTQFETPIAIVSEDGENYHFINTLGERVSLFTFPEVYALEDTRMHYEGDLKIVYYMQNYHQNRFNYEYYLTEDCACDPRPYYPCPARFPMDTSDVSKVIKNVQEMQFLVEFYTVDSALKICNQLIEEDQNEPQYYYYKAWLIDQAFPVSMRRFSALNYDSDFPEYIWDELIRLRDKGLIGEDEKKKMYLQQYENLQDEIKLLEGRGEWDTRNMKDANRFTLHWEDYIDYIWADNYGNWTNDANTEIRKRSYYDAIDALTEVIKLEKVEEIVMLSKAWQNDIIADFHFEYLVKMNENIPFETVFKSNVKALLKHPNLYDVLNQEKFGMIGRFNGVYRNGQIGVGVGLSFGSITRINKIRTAEMSVGLGYNHYFMDEVEGEYYIDWTIGPTGWIETRFSPSILTDYTGTVGIGFLPSVGFRLWDVYLSYGYNFARKSKFSSLRGHTLGLSYGFNITNERRFLKKEDAFDF